MALGAEHEHPAGGERLLLQACDLITDLLRLVLALLAFQTGQFLLDTHVGIAAELNVGTTTGHVGRDRDRARNARLRDDIGFLFVIARVQDREYLGLLGAFVTRIECGKGIRVGEVVRLPTLLAQHLGKRLGFLDRGGAHQHRLAPQLAVFQQRDDRAVFLGIGAVNFVILIVADHRTVGRHLDNTQIVDVEKLVRFGQRGSGHAARACRTCGNNSGR